MRCRYCCRHFRRIVINGFVAFAMILLKVFLRLIEIIQKPKRCDTHRFWDYRHPVMFKLNIESEGELCATWSVYGFCSAHSSISMLMIARYSFIKLFIYSNQKLCMETFWLCRNANWNVHFGKNCFFTSKFVCMEIKSFLIFLIGLTTEMGIFMIRSDSNQI